jgi:hypothetical protein
MEVEIAVSLTLTGAALDPQQLTAWTGLLPSRTWMAGELIREGALLRYEHSGWSIRSGLPHSRSLEDHVDALLRRLKPGWDTLLGLCQRYDAEVACAVYSYGGARPAIHLRKDQCRRLSELNASLDVDVYALPKRRK